MSLNESIVEDAALATPAATLIPAFSQREKEEDSDVAPGGALARGDSVVKWQQTTNL